MERERWVSSEVKEKWRERERERGIRYEDEETWRIRRDEF